MIKTVLIDDEKHALEVLQWQLQTYCNQVQVLACCSSADEGITAIREHQPQLVFLDIEMPKKNGFAVIQAFPEAFFDIIFTTAYNQFALKAFRVAALDYLLKPIDADDLVTAVQRFEKKTIPRQLTQQFGLLLQQFGQAPVLPLKLSFTTAQAVHFIEPATIVYCESNSNYTTLHFLDKSKMLVSKTLKEVEEMLLPYDFYRVHHSFLINKKRVSLYLKADGGSIEMSEGSQVPVSRQKKEEVIRVLNGK